MFFNEFMSTAYFILLLLLLFLFFYFLFFYVLGLIILVGCLISFSSGDLIHGAKVSALQLVQVRVYYTIWRTWFRRLIKHILWCVHVVVSRIVYSVIVLCVALFCMVVCLECCVFVLVLLSFSFSYFDK